MRHPHGREPVHLDRPEVPAAAFDVKNLLLLADHIPFAHFDGSVPAAVKHEGVVAAEQARSINAQLQIGAASRRLSGIPQVLHRAPCIEQRLAELPMAKTKRRVGTVAV